MNTSNTRQEHKGVRFMVKENCELMIFLMTKMSGISRTKVKNMLSNGLVWVDDEVVSQYNFMLQPGMQVRIGKKEEKRKFTSKWMRIVFEDKYIVVVEKREGIVTNSPTDEVSIQRVLNNYFEFTRQRCRAHTVHRLDKHTSGLLIFAKDKKISFMFEKNWKDIISDRRYVAVVEGFMEKEYGTVESYLKDNRMFVSYSSDTDDGGKHAITHYKTLKRKPDFSLVELRLETGRKNQIRVHMHDLKHPIVGDEKYGSTSDPIKRVALHAYKLSFTHPITNEELSFETPIPTNFMQLL
ncbi:MAG: RluA family pseudouridine synthase [Bacteroidales bacterium]|jgi:23S rRNA pseudouridine1911/1915/1917 synthase|nr:RluA family pseudouridine synthase [Bacteroidales bacterium]